MAKPKRDAGLRGLREERDEAGGETGDQSGDEAARKGEGQVTKPRFDRRYVLCPTCQTKVHYRLRAGQSSRLRCHPQWKLTLDSKKDPLFGAKLPTLTFSGLGGDMAITFATRGAKP